MIRIQIDQLSWSISNRQLFPEKPTLHFTTEATHCACGHPLNVTKTRIRTLSTLTLGEFNAKETLKSCLSCRKQHGSQELRSLVPQRSLFGFDVMVFIGQALLVDCKNESIIQQELAQKNIHISLREIGYLSKRFIVYLSIAHQACQADMKQLMADKGGYILHLDGTCEGESPHIFSVIDAISNLVLDNQKMATENSQSIVTLLQRVKSAYGHPLALVHDMSHAISNAIQKVFPNTRDYICHFHFLRDLGKDLFAQEHNTLKRHFKTFKTRALLQKSAKQLKQIIDQDQTLTQSLTLYLKQQQPDVLEPEIKAYLLVTWVIEAARACDGYGFPFDQPHLAFYLRLQDAYPGLKQLKQLGISSLPILALSRVIRYSPLITTADRLQKKLNVFNQLRQAMKIAEVDHTQGLNDEGDEDLKTIKHRVTCFRHSEEIKQLAQDNITYTKMLKQIDKYWDKLFADPITISTPNGQIHIQPQRTNNLLERSFRFLKRGGRKKSGQKNLSKILKAMLADTPLIRNLNHPEYMALLLKGKKSLAERFAEIDIQQVRQQEKKNQETLQKYPKRMARLFKIQNLPKILLTSSSK